MSGVLATVVLGGTALIRGRRGILLTLLGLLPCIPIVVSLFREHGDIKGALGFAKIMSEAYLPMVSVVVCLFLGCAALGEEVEGKTLPYLLSRAVPRASILIGRFLSYALSASLLLTPGVVACYLLTVMPMGKEALWIDLPYLSAMLGGTYLSVLAYGSVFFMLSVFMKRAMLAGIMLIFAWESWASVAPLPVANYSVLHHVFVALLHWTQAPVFLDLAGLRQPEDAQTAARAVRVLMGITAVALTISVVRFRRKEYPA